MAVRLAAAAAVIGGDPLITGELVDGWVTSMAAASLTCRGTIVGESVKIGSKAVHGLLVKGGGDCFTASSLITKEGGGGSSQPVDLSCNTNIC